MLMLTTAMYAGLGVSSCSENNGGCSGLCITGEARTSSSHQCLCSESATTHLDTDACNHRQLHGNDCINLSY